MKVRIVGAGPSGSVAAISAMRSGHEAELHEEHARAGYPQHCSGLISKEGLGSLSDMLDYEPHVINRISCASFDFAGEKFEIRRKTDTAFVIDRAEFDAALAQKAEEEGARMFYGKRYLHTGGTGSWKPEAIIGADGALSATARHFNFPKIRKFAFTLKARAKIMSEEPHKVSLFYDNRNFPGFFGWLIPHDECEAEIGMGTTRQEHLAPGFRFLLKKLKPDSYEKPAGKVIPLHPREKTAGVFGRTNVLLAGDAAGHVKASSGGGVVFGTAGARLAGALAHSPSEYEAAWRREISRDMLAHRFLQGFFEIQPNPALALTAGISRRLGLDYLFSLHGNMDRPTRIFASALSKAFNSPGAANREGESIGAGKDAG
ncbi:Digeranylgeranylglycerophospholipid reductase [uncultured archaeon]|nr:Digeranylgeranylglycerophospholipid reductase [uncultured archaeon]